MTPMGVTAPQFLADPLLPAEPTPRPPRGDLSAARTVADRLRVRRPTRPCGWDRARVAERGYRALLCGAPLGLLRNASAADGGGGLNGIDVDVRFLAPPDASRTLTRRVADAARALLAQGDVVEDDVDAGSRRSGVEDGGGAAAPRWLLVVPRDVYVVSDGLGSLVETLRAEEEDAAAEAARGTGARAAGGGGGGALVGRVVRATPLSDGAAEEVDAASGFLVSLSIV